ncbi:MAG: thioesterase family protein [Bacteroidales bacterium]|nr:thioesterase family protein [Bacteroidales bacterium]MDD3521831.1 thioesterase family protein [Bacteroidales bacterium]MDD4030205.1 thioesterase family protein [Bacteroidales bacterium]MDD4435157.1 thioesterase family protein [Bacteroidales bacterium]MDD5733272.1 thioesterase family protein [Bacteroidales bacterium]
MKNNNKLTESKQILIRFSEVDSMSIVWHGSYVLYFEDAREAFGRKYGLTYQTYFDNGYYAPLVDMKFEFKHPLEYGDTARIEIEYIPVEAAKVIFHYSIYREKDNRLAATGSTTQVFLDSQYRLVLYNPDFYTAWKKKNNVL